MSRFFEDDAASQISVDDFAFTMTSGASTFAAIFEYAYGDQFGFGDRQVPTLTAKTSEVAAVSVDDIVTVPAAAIPTSGSSKNFAVLVKQPDNSGVTVLVLETEAV
jgi:hypothetical protein